jgi:AcrR family transcriptional regulator
VSKPVRSVRAEQKQRTRRALMDAALSQLSQEKGFASLSLREVSREAGIAPTSFYRHFTEMEELGLALVDEAGLALRQLLRQARKRINTNESAVDTSIDIYMQYLGSNPNHFRLLLREGIGVSAQFRSAIRNELKHFESELTEDLKKFGEAKNRELDNPELVAEAMVTLAFSKGAEALDCPPKQRNELKANLKTELRMILVGAESMSQFKKNQKND